MNRFSWQKLLSYFQASDSCRPYQLYSHSDYLQLPTEVISSLSRTILSCHTGPGDGLMGLAGHQDEMLKMKNWQMPNEDIAYGLSTSLYDRDPFTGQVNGEPIADCFAICAQENNAILIIADGISWGYKPRLAARCAVHGAMASLHQQLWNKRINTTKDVFQCIRMAIDAAQALILSEQGSLTTLTISIVCTFNGRWFVCSAIIGDSNAYVYSRKQRSVFELNQGSRNLNDERDMRSPGGALGMTIDEKADLSNLTYSIMEIERDDFVYLTTDGISDNYDPHVNRTATSSSATPHERYLGTLHHMRLLIDDKDNACHLCHHLAGHVIQLTNEQRQTIEQGVRENQAVTGSARIQFEKTMQEKLEKLPGKLDHASIVAYLIR